jgi:hypothetical protein
MRLVALTDDGASTRQSLRTVVSWSSSAVELVAWLDILCIPLIAQAWTGRREELLSPPDKVSSLGLQSTYRRFVGLDPAP